MKALLILLLLVSGYYISAQEAGLIIKNNNTQKEKFIKENKRVKITTLSGAKVVGRLQIIDEHTIMLRGNSIFLGEIKKVKRHPPIVSIGNSIGFLALASGTFITGALASDSSLRKEEVSDIPLYIGIGLSIGALYAATQPINIFNKGYDVNKKWKFEIAISLPEIQNSSNKNENRNRLKKK